MDIFYHCMSAVLQECQKTGLTIKKDLCKIDNSIEINFDLPANRVSFLYKFSIFNMHISKKCFSEFASDCPEISAVLDRMLSSKLVCSLSNGPGIDIVGLQLALKELGKTFNKRTLFKIISKYGSCRNTMNTLMGSNSNASAISVIGTFKLLQCNIMESITSKAENCLKSADIVLMDHSFASPNAQKSKIVDTLKILLNYLKPGAYIFFIDTKTKVSYFELFSSYGTYIYGPKGVQVDDLPYDKEIAQHIGEEPVHSGKAYFGVWQKNTEAEDIMTDNVSLVNVIPATGNFKENSSCDKNIKPDMHRIFENMSSTSTPVKKRQENIIHNTPLVNVKAMQTLEKSTSCKSNATSQLHSSTENLSAPFVLMKPSLGDVAVSKNVSCSLTATTNTTSGQNIISSSKRSANSKNTEAFDQTCAEDMKALLCSLNSLVIKLENFLSSEIASKNLGPLKCNNHISACSCICDNRCLNYYHCCLNKRCCSHYYEHDSSEKVSSNTNQSCNCHTLANQC